MNKHEVLRLEKIINDELINEDELYEAAINEQIDFFVPIQKGESSIFLYKSNNEIGEKSQILFINQTKQDEVEALCLSKQDCEALYWYREIETSCFSKGVVFLKNEKSKISTAEELYENKKIKDEDKQVELDFYGSYGKDRKGNSKIADLSVNFDNKNNYDLFDERERRIGYFGKWKILDKALSHYGLGMVQTIEELDSNGDVLIKQHLLTRFLIKEKNIFVLKSQIMECFGGSFDRQKVDSFIDNETETETETEMPVKDFLETFKLDNNRYGEALHVANQYVNSIFDIDTGKYQPPEDLYTLAAVCIYAWKELMEEDYGKYLSSKRVTAYLEEAEIDRPEHICSVVVCDHAKKKKRATPTQLPKLKKSVKEEPWKKVSLHRILLAWSDAIKTELQSYNNPRNFVDNVEGRLEENFKDFNLSVEPTEVLIEMFTRQFE